jgi:hypothetical protein
MIGIYDQNLHYRLTAQGFDQGGIRCADGVHFLTKDGNNLNQNATSVGDWERCTRDGNLLTFAVDPTTVYVVKDL